jgi:hypothetical protein
MVYILLHSWYEVRRDSNGNYAIHQQGTYAPNDSISRFYASIAQDKLGNIGLGYSVSSATLNPGTSSSSVTCDLNIWMDQTLRRSKIGTWASHCFYVLSLRRDSRCRKEL